MLHADGKVLAPLFKGKWGRPVLIQEVGRSVRYGMNLTPAFTSRGTVKPLGERSS
jgi:hypothetical protein